MIRDEMHAIRLKAKTVKVCKHNWIQKLIKDPKTLKQLGVIRGSVIVNRCSKCKGYKQK
jgi:hypothetical protein